jgi:hypothetical protein
VGLAADDRIGQETDRHAKFFVSYNKVSVGHCYLPTRRRSPCGSAAAVGRFAICDVNVLRETFLTNPRRENAGEGEKKCDRRRDLSWGEAAGVRDEQTNFDRFIWFLVLTITALAD